MDNIRNIINEGRPKESDRDFYEPYWYRVGVHDGYDYAFKELEENRLKHAQTLSDAESKREMEYVSQFIKEHHRTPTFSDAIEATRKQMIEKMELIINNILGGYIIREFHFGNLY